MTDIAFRPFASTVSKEARAQYAAAQAEEANTALNGFDDMRRDADRRTASIVARRLARYGTRVRNEVTAGVPTALVTPPGHDGEASRGPLLLNFHGGGFVIDYSALSESIPVAALSGIPVRTAFYRLAPENSFPAAVDDALAVYRDALTTREPSEIAVFGTSAGAILTAQLMAWLAAEGLPKPAAAGLFSVTADFARPGDCEATLPPLVPGLDVPAVLSTYRGAADPRDPLVSPLFGDLTVFPPTLLMTSTRDQMLSQTVLLNEALLAAGVRTSLRVFEGMLHAFWMTLESPESEAALAAQAAFLAGEVKRAKRAR